MKGDRQRALGPEGASQGCGSHALVGWRQEGSPELVAEGGPHW